MAPRTWLPALLILVLASGCAHQTQFTSNYADVAVNLDGKDLGTTGPGGEPVTVVRPWLINEGFPRQYTLTLTKPGYKTRKEIISSSYHADESLAWLAAFIVPYFFTARLEKSYHFEMEPDVPERLEPDVGPAKPDGGGSGTGDPGPDLGGPDLD